jgi:hypothetical protein
MSRHKGRKKRQTEKPPLIDVILERLARCGSPRVARWAARLLAGELASSGSAVQKKEARERRS